MGEHELTDEVDGIMGQNTPAMLQNVWSRPGGPGGDGPGGRGRLGETQGRFRSGSFSMRLFEKMFEYPDHLHQHLVPGIE